jgi:hypothetical protein
MFNLLLNCVSPSSTRSRSGVLTAIVLAANMITAGWATEAPTAREASPLPALPASSEQIAEKCGIEVSGLFLSAGGNMVDFRYRVLDPAKAAALTKADLKPSLVDQTTGAKLIIPSTPKVGPLRQTIAKPVPGKIYFMLFANTRHHVKSGDKVTIVAGDCKIDNLTVE